MTLPFVLTVGTGLLTTSAAILWAAYVSPGAEQATKDSSDSKARDLPTW